MKICVLIKQVPDKDTSYKINDDNEVVRVGGIKYTIKDGIVYDAKQLLKDVENMVKKAKRRDGELEQY